MLENPTDRTGPTGPNWASAARSSETRDAAQWRNTLPGFLSALRRRRASLLATILAVPLCAYLVLLQVVPRYTATGSLIYQSSEYQARELQSMVRSTPITDATMISQTEMLHSRSIAQKVTERGNLYENPEFNASLRPPGRLQHVTTFVHTMLGINAAEPTETPLYGPVIDRDRDRTVTAVQDALKAVPVHMSQVIEVTFTAEDPFVAAAAVNLAMDAYIKGLYADRHKKVEAGTTHLQTEAMELRRVVTRAEEKITAYRNEHGLSQGIHAGTDTEQITHLSEDLSKARSERANADAKLDAARGRKGAAAQAAVAPSVVQLRTQQSLLAGQMKAQQARLGSAHPAVQAAARQLADAEQAITSEIGRVIEATEAEQHAATLRVETLEHVMADTEAAAGRAADQQIPLNAMTRDLDAARVQLQSVLELIQKTQHQTSIESPEAHEISLAIPPDHPISPRIVPVMAATCVAAIFLGMLLVYVLDMADQTLSSGDDLRLLTGLPCFALLPEVAKRARGHLNIQDYVVRRPLTAFAEQIRSLRLAISLDIDHPQIVAVTAARPAEAKSITTIALGRSAQLGGERVLAIECDVRQASFQHRLGSGPGPGLLEILRNQVEWRDAIRGDTITGMDYIIAGKPDGDVLGQFMSDQMRQLLANLREHYDLILLDAPPVEAMTEARIAATLADATLVCVRWRSTQQRTLHRALEMLRDAHVKILGTVLTRVDANVHLRSGHADAGVYHRRYKAYFRG